MASSEPGDGVATKKMFIPLENNPIVFSKLSAALGIEKTIQYHDVYSIDDLDLLSFIPRPVYAVLFTCPAQVYKRARDAENAEMAEYSGAGVEEPVIWFRQTIGNACGLIAWLHGVSNGGAQKFITPGSALEQLLKQIIPLFPTERAEVLYRSQELETGHGAAAELGDTPPTTEEHVGNHYICFVKGGDGHLWELNGGMKGPVDRGPLTEHEDALSERALQLGVRSFMRHAGSQDLDFSMVAIAPVLPDSTTDT
ncbi:MAG: hypothetical protein Q9195_007857 [Heterodermia aff. obscurata]